MADAGVGEAAILAAVAPEVIGGTVAAGATAATTAAALAAMAPTAAEPIFLGGAVSEPAAAGPVIEGGVWDSAATPGLLGDTGAAGTWEGPVELQVSDLSAPGVLDTGTWSEAGSKGLLDKAAAWWDKATLGEKLKAGGTLVSGVSTAAKAATPST